MNEKVTGTLAYAHERMQGLIDELEAAGVKAACHVILGTKWKTDSTPGFGVLRISRNIEVVQDECANMAEPAP